MASQSSMALFTGAGNRVGSAGKGSGKSRLLAPPLASPTPYVPVLGPRAEAGTGVISVSVDDDYVMPGAAPAAEETWTAET